MHVTKDDVFVEVRHWRNNDEELVFVVRVEEFEIDWLSTRRVIVIIVVIKEFWRIKRIDEINEIDLF